jgi:hypothetical protein
MATYIIATEEQAKSIGESSYAVVNNLAVTKTRAIYLGCTVRNAEDYLNN